MIKKCIRSVLLLLLCAAAPLAAVDYGGIIGDTAEYRGTTGAPLAWYESASSRLWVSAPLFAPAKLKFSAEGSYQFRFDQADGSRKHILDMNLLKFSCSVPAGSTGMVDVAAGRFFLSDATGVIFAQVCDGAFAKLKLPGFELSAYGGTTALLNAQNVTILTPPQSSRNSDFRQVYVLCPAYIPAGISASFPSLFLNQTLSAECWMFIDTSSLKYNRLYGTLSLSGPLSGNVFYALSTTAATETGNTVSNLSKLSVSFYPVPQAAVGIQGAYASGKTGFLSPFTGFTSYLSSSAFAEPEYSGLIKADVTGSYTVVSGVCLTGRCGVLFDCPGERVSYGGWQWNIAATWNIFPDVQVSAGAYQYYAQQQEKNRTQFTASVAFVF